MKEIGGYGAGGDSSSPSPGPLTSTSVTPITTDTHHAVHALARHPAYSINNILGMHPDANENVLKRKRDNDGERIDE